jgi:hypothetical protein
MALGHDFLVFIGAGAYWPPFISDCIRNRDAQAVRKNYIQVAAKIGATTEADFNLRPPAGKPRLFSGYTSAPFWYDVELGAGV